MRYFFMCVGVPASGKSTFVKKMLVGPEAIVISTDDYIEKIAQENGISYSDAFEHHIFDANKAMYNDLYNALDDESITHIFWDQTNLTVKSRASKLKSIPDSFYKSAIFFPTPEKEEWERRLLSRPGKSIPKNILDNMAKSLVEPTLSEGFALVMNGAIEGYGSL